MSQKNFTVHSVVILFATETTVLEEDVIGWWNNHTFDLEDVIGGFWSSEDISVSGNDNDTEIFYQINNGFTDGRYKIEMHQTTFGKCYTITVSC